MKTMIPLRRWLVNRLNAIASLLEQESHSAGKQSKFVDLAPTDQADKTGVYSEAILFATNNEKVSNIALTGPYGSGKSSIIRSFLKKYRRPALHISLAAFVPEADSGGEKVSRQEIERSILQQMLYGADANKLPLSRFKRIQSPGVWSILKSFFMMLGILALWYVFDQRENIISGAFFVPFSLSNWLKLATFVLALVFLWMTLHHFYVASFGLSLKSISLKDVEIKPAHDDQASILNRHLDEIIYFFQSTDYDLVVIEDIDRFEDAEIFVTLREINSLVNENAGVKRTIRFLYALRDDMFINTDRTKFFEFIIPVIPIINTSNSIDMVLEQGHRLKLDGRLDRQFLREVSRYLNDLRLIQNIFNEYAIYAANLETDGESLLDANKLLAILIYKNVYPRDFERLHRGSGNLAELLNRQVELIGHSESKYKAEIAELERRLEVADRQTPADLRELRQIYSMALIEKLPANVVRISPDQRKWITIAQMASDDAFEQLIGASRLFLRNVHSQQQQIDVSKLLGEAHFEKSYEQRKEEIESKAADNKSKILRRIGELRSKISTLRTAKLNELLRLNVGHIQDLFGGIENEELARFLILEGHLDDTYYQYTSLFHSGRLSPNDNKFLIQIRAFVTPDPGFPIDNPKEVIAAMRDEDFRQSYVLNVKLVDGLLGERSSYVDQTQKLFQFLSSDFESCENFIDAYYTSGRYVGGLILGLVKAETSLVPTFIASPNNISHIAQLLLNLPEDFLKNIASDYDGLPKFVSANLPEILINSPELEPERLACLSFEVKDLAAINEHPETVRFMFESGLFELTVQNLEYIYQAIFGGNDLKALRESNLTVIRATNNAALMNRVERDFDHYVTDILLELEENSKEDANAIIEVVRHDTLDDDDVKAFLKRQTNPLTTLERVPERWQATFFDLNLVEPNWENCFEFIESEGFDVHSLTGYLDRETVRKIILERPIPSDPDSAKLRQLLFNAGSLSDAAYGEYVQALPKPFNGFPKEFESSKIKILINSGKINFTKDSVDQLTENRSLQVLFFAANIDTYLSAAESFELDEDFLESLLQSQISHTAKIRIVKLMDLGAVVGLPERAALVGSIIKNSDIGVFDLDVSIIKSLIENSRPIETQISLLNKCHAQLKGDEVREVLANLPRPFSEIKTGYKAPRLERTPENIDLVRWLDSRNIISSWSEGKFFKGDIKVNLYRR